MHTRQIQRGRDRLAVPPFIAIGTPSVVLALAEGEDVVWLSVLLVSALTVLAIHLFVLGMWQKVAVWRVRRHVDAALILGDTRSLRRAAAEAAEAKRDWPGSEIWVLGKALEVMRHRVERTV